MSYTLLKMVQLILSSMNGDEVNSINDTVESRQVVDIIETTYNDLISGMDLPEQKDFFELVPSGDSTRPTILTLPPTIQSYDFLQYDVSTGTERQMVTLKPLDRYSFFRRMENLDSAASNVYHFDYTSGPDSTSTDIRGYNDRDPSFYTIINDRTIVFDNYLKTTALTIVGTRTLGYGKFAVVFVRTDDFVAAFDDQNFSFFFNEAKSQCSLELRQVQNTKADQRARQAKVRTQNHKDRPDGSTAPPSPSYGRQRASTFKRFLNEGV